MPPPLPRIGTKKAPHVKVGKHSPISQCGQGESKTFDEKTCRGPIYNLVEWGGFWVEGRAYGGWGSLGRRPWRRRGRGEERKEEDGTAPRVGYKYPLKKISAISPVGPVPTPEFPARTSVNRPGDRKFRWRPEFLAENRKHVL